MDPEKYSEQFWGRALANASRVTKAGAKKDPAAAGRKLTPRIEAPTSAPTSAEEAEEEEEAGEAAETEAEAEAAAA